MRAFDAANRSNHPSATPPSPEATGRVEIGSLKVIRATHELFAAAVKNAFPRMRLTPAEVGSNKVRQLVQQAFTFAIVK
jgi:hypothetical protein